VCHNSPGLEDAPKYTYSSWYVGPTPGATMDFRQLVHRIHACKELTRPYVVNGVFLGTPYPVTYDTVGFPSFKGGVSECTKCHGANNTAWKQPAAEEHFFVQTYNGSESCAVCHGPGREYSVEIVHKVR